MSESKIHSAMVSVMREAVAIGKDQTNQQQKFKYRGIDDVYNSLHDLVAKHGIFCTSKVLDRSREERVSKGGSALIYTSLHVEYTFWAEDGSSVSSSVWGEGMDSGDKSSNKALAVAHKYALLQAFMIPTNDMTDPDSQAHEVKATNKDRIENWLLASVNGDIEAAAVKIKTLTKDKYNSLNEITDTGHIDRLFQKCKSDIEKFERTAK